jgi:hypothetical protein
MNGHEPTDDHHVDEATLRASYLAQTLVYMDEVETFLHEDPKADFGDERVADLSIAGARLAWTIGSSLHSIAESLAVLAKRPPVDGVGLGR